jgi:hypothetical protein
MDDTFVISQDHNDELIEAFKISILTIVVVFQEMSLKIT